MAWGLQLLLLWMNLHASSCCSPVSRKLSRTAGYMFPYIREDEQLSAPLMTDKDHNHIREQMREQLYDSTQHDRMHAEYLFESIQKGLFNYRFNIKFHELKGTSAYVHTGVRCCGQMSVKNTSMGGSRSSAVHKFPYMMSAASALSNIPWCCMKPCICPSNVSS